MAFPFPLREAGAPWLAAHHPQPPQSRVNSLCPAPQSRFVPVMDIHPHNISIYYDINT